MIKTVQFSANFVVCLNSNYTTAEIQLKFLVTEIMVIQQTFKDCNKWLFFSKYSLKKKTSSKSEKIICYWN